jgi:UPF0755 protein
MDSAIRARIRVVAAAFRGEVFAAKLRIALVAGGLALVVFSFLISPPSVGEIHRSVRVAEGMNARQAFIELERSGVIRSAWAALLVDRIVFFGAPVIAGDYYFEKTAFAPDAVSRLVAGDYGLFPVRVTIPEGTNVFQIAKLFGSDFTFFDPEEFIRNAPEGYLFPDTYFFFPNADARSVIRKMMDNFDEKTQTIREEAERRNIPFADIVTMASILEEEGSNADNRGNIASILWRRIEIDMPLQVDAAFHYVNGESTYDLSLADLRIESPYNTYRNKGLPPGPISNPGLESLEAALNPIPNEYLYFLTDLSGDIYYAKDFDGHQRNRELYLRRP